MKFTILTYSAMATFMIWSCHDKINTISDRTKQDSIHEINTYIEGNNLDSLDRLLDFEIPDSTIDKTKDSIDYLYAQISARLLLKQNDSDLGQMALEYHKLINSSRQIYDSLAHIDAQMLGYSYYRATEAGIKERNVYYYLLKQRLFLMKSILENTYWNYGFDKTK